MEKELDEVANKYRVTESVNRKPGLIEKKVGEAKTANWMRMMKKKI